MMVFGIATMGKRYTIRLSEEDEAALEVVMRRYGQRNVEGTFRLCLQLVAQAKGLALESSEVEVREPERPHAAI